MKPIRAGYKKNADALMNCYCFQLEYFSGSKRMMINMNKNKAYFIDEPLDILNKNEVHNYFSEEWVQELIHIFLKNKSCQTFEYCFETKVSRFSHDRHLLFNLFSHERNELPIQGMSYKPD